MADKIDVLLKIHDEHAAQARQHENQRERIANYILIIVGILVTFISNSNFAAYSIPASMLLIILGIYGFMFTRKHYERNRLHVSILSKFLEEINKELTKKNSSKSTLKEIRNAGEQTHYENFPEKEADKTQQEEKVNKTQQEKAKDWSARHRLNSYWLAIPIFSVAIGLIFLLITILIWYEVTPIKVSKPIEVKIVR